MGRPRKNASSAPLKGDLLSMLPAERQREIIDEVIGVHVRALFETHQSGTLGALVDALKSHPHWNNIREVSVSQVMRPKAAAQRASAPRSSGPTAKAGRKRARLDDSTLDALVEVKLSH